MDYGWDIMIKRDIPRESIETVVRSDDPMVSGLPISQRPTAMLARFRV